MSRDRWITRLVLCILILAVASACTTPATTQPNAGQSVNETVPTQPATATFTPSPLPPTATFTAVPATATALPSATPTQLSRQDVEATLTAWPTDTPEPSPSAAASLVAPQNTSAPGAALPGSVENSVKIFFILKNTGGPICGDSVIGIGTSIPRTGDVAKDVAAALKLLFTYKSKYVSDLYNPIYASSFNVSDVHMNSGLITVQMTGKYVRTKEKCDNSRVKAVVWSTIKQFREITATNIYLNRVPFGDLVSNDG